MLFARELRTKGTIAEVVLWDKLKSRRLGVKFRRQVAIDCFVVDFCCFSNKLIIELDGEVHKRPSRRMVDIERRGRLEKMGYRVIRFWNNEVMSDIEVVLEEIKRYLIPRNSGASLSVNTEREIR